MRKSILIEITNKCNLRCRHCYNSSYLNNQDIDEAKLYNNILFLKNQGFNHIHFLGGEPLLNNRLNKYITDFMNLGFSISLNTNATVFDENFINKGLPYVDQISFSLDGTDPKMNDSIRNTGTFNKVIESINSISFGNTKLLLNYVVTNQNYSNLFQLLKIADQLKVDIINILWFYSTGENDYMSPKKEDYDLIFDEFEKLLVQNSFYNIEINFDLKPKVLEYFKKIGLIQNFRIKSKCKCFAEDTNIYMNIYGKVYPCHPFNEKIGVTYDFEHTSYDGYLEDISGLLDKYKTAKQNAFCTYCEFRGVCLNCPITDGNITLCQYIENRIKDKKRYICQNIKHFSLNPSYRLLFDNSIINLNNNTIIPISNDCKTVLIERNQVNDDSCLLELYGLRSRGVIDERLS